MTRNLFDQLAWITLCMKDQDPFLGMPRRRLARIWRISSNLSFVSSDRTGCFNFSFLLPKSDANKEKSLSPKDQIKGHPRNKSPKLRKFDQYGEKTVSLTKCEAAATKLKSQDQVEVQASMDLLPVTCSGMDKTAISSSLDRFIYSPTTESWRLEDYKVKDYRKEACFLIRKVNVDLVLDILSSSLNIQSITWLYLP